MDKYFHSWTEAASYLNQKINKMRPLQGRNVQLTNTGSGIRIDSITQAVASTSTPAPVEAYNDYFTCVLGAGYVDVIDGKTRVDGSCGFAVVGTKNIKVPSVRLLVSAPCLIGLRATYDENSAQYTVIPKVYDESENGAFWTLASVYMDEALATLKLEQYWQDGYIDFNHRYWL